MRTSSIWLSAIVGCASLVSAGGDVFAHFIIGTAAAMTPADWATQVATAAAAGIDAFALDIALDSYTDTQLGYAYAAAANHGNFGCFLQFDFAAASGQGGFTQAGVVNTINNYKSRAGQYTYQGKPLVSTFEGTDDASWWPDIKSQTGCVFAPDYTSLGPQNAASQPGVDGLLSWDAWPDGTADTPTSASAWKSALGSRPFIMPVSPWFYTNIPNVKNWLWKGALLWPQSWAQATSLQPAAVEIVTWNDWGESSYVGPNPRDTSAYPSGSAGYAGPGNHSAWLADLPYYIKAYKTNGVPESGSYRPHVTFWYRLSPGAACAGTNTPCNAPYQSDHPAAADCDQDEIYYTVFPDQGQSAGFTMSMGGSSITVNAPNAGLYSGSIPFSSFAGLGEVSVNAGALGSGTGAAIQNSCVAGWNAFVAGTM